MKTIVWSDLAYVTFTEIADYLTEIFSLDAALKFSEAVKKLLGNLETFEGLCPKHPRRKGYRKCIINRYASLVYRIDGSSILLIAFQDNRSEHFI